MATSIVTNFEQGPGTNSTLASPVPVSTTLDFSKLNVAASAAVNVFGLAKGTVVMACGIEVLTPEATSGATATLGTTASDTAFIATAASVTAAGATSAFTPAYISADGQYLTLVPTTALTTLKVKVWAILASV